MKDELLIKFLLKETSEEENIKVNRWLTIHSDNQAYFLQFEKIWQAGKNLASKSHVDEEQAWLKFKEKTTAIPTNKTTTNTLNPIFNWLKIAAVFILIAGGWLTYSLFIATSYKDLVANNQIRIEKLPDGSEITLNKNSEISYANDFKNDRSIRLKKGNVFFNVAHDKTKPFVIVVDNISVQVVGTSFNIKHFNDETEVIVETGIVKVNLENEEIQLQRGEKVLINKASTKLVREQHNDQLYNYYRSGLFIARNIPLGSLIAALNEAYGAQIVFSDPKIENEPIVTTLKASNTLDYNLKNICNAMDLKISRNQDQIILSKNK